MAIIFDFEPGERFHFASAFAKRFNAQSSGERVYLPDTLGEGYIQEVYPDDELSICMHRYTLKQELILRPRSSGTSEVLTLKFDSARAPFGNGYQVEFVKPQDEEANLDQPDDPADRPSLVLHARQDSSDCSNRGCSPDLEAKSATWRRVGRRRSCKAALYSRPNR